MFRAVVVVVFASGIGALPNGAIAGEHADGSAIEPSRKENVGPSRLQKNRIDVRGGSHEADGALAIVAAALRGVDAPRDLQLALHPLHDATQSGRLRVKVIAWAAKLHAQYPPSVSEEMLVCVKYPTAKDGTCQPV